MVNGEEVVGNFIGIDRFAINSAGLAGEVQTLRCAISCEKAL